MSYRLRRGLGTFGPAPVPPVPENCMFDRACIARNAAASDAYLAAKYIYDYGGPPPSDQGVVVQQGDTPFVNTPPVQTVNSDGTPVTQAATVAPASVATTQIGKAIVSSSGTADAATSGTSTTASSTTVGGFDLSTIPWWGWLAAGGAVLFMMKGGSR